MDRGKNVLMEGQRERNEQRVEWSKGRMGKGGIDRGRYGQREGLTERGMDRGRERWTKEWTEDDWTY
jgi:hypothetical protein